MLRWRALGRHSGTRESRADRDWNVGDLAVPSGEMPLRRRKLGRGQSRIAAPFAPGGAAGTGEMRPARGSGRHRGIAVRPEWPAVAGGSLPSGVARWDRVGADPVPYEGGVGPGAGACALV